MLSYKQRFFDFLQQGGIIDLNGMEFDCPNSVRLCYECAFYRIKTSGVLWCLGQEIVWKQLPKMLNVLFCIKEERLSE